MFLQLWDAHLTHSHLPITSAPSDKREQKPSFNLVLPNKVTVAKTQYLQNRLPSPYYHLLDH